MIRGGVRVSSLTARRLSALAFEAYGSPQAVLKSAPSSLPSVGPSDVALHLKATYVDTEDLLAIQGLSPLKPSPGIAGLYAVGTVTSAGASVAGLSVSDSVLVCGSSVGTWTKDAVTAATNVIKIPNSLNLTQAAVLPAVVTAHAVLTDAKVSTGDVVVHNCGKTPVGMAITQVAKKLGAKAVPVGESVPGPVKLGIDTIGGKSAADVCKTLGEGATFVSVGTSAEVSGLKFPVRALIFSDLTIKGFNFFRYAKSSPSAFASSVSASAEMLAKGEVSISLTPTPLTLETATKAVSVGGGVLTL